MQFTSVDVFLSATDQQKSSHQGVTGRVKSMSNAQSVRFQHETPTMPARFLLEPRKGFSSLPLDCRDTLGVAINTPSWVSCDYLSEISDSLVTIDSRRPRVWNGYDYWVDYGSDTNVVTNKLREDTIVGGYGVIQGQDSAVIGHVQAIAYVQNQKSVYLGFREAPGAPADSRRAGSAGAAWISPPVLIASPSVSSVAKVRSDGTNFWVFYNDLVFLHASVYDTTGTRLATATIVKLDTFKSPGFWDIDTDHFDPTKLVLAQPANSTTNPAVDVHVQFSILSYATGAITVASNTDSTIKCNGLCTFIANERGVTDVNSYLITTAPGATNQNVFLYRVNLGSTPVSTSERNIVDSVVPVDAATGYVEAGNLFTAHAVIGFLETFNSVGPQYDPQLRTIATYEVTNSAVTEVRRSCGQALASRTFPLGTGHVHATYYQSGSGLEASRSVITPAITVGDFFTGSQKQTIKVVPGDYTTGSHLTIGGEAVRVAGGMTAALSVQAGDTVEAIMASSSDPPDAPTGFRVPDGTPLYKWTFANFPFTLDVPPSKRSAFSSWANICGGTLEMLGGSIAGTNGNWPIVAGWSTSGFADHCYTLRTKEDGTAGTFTPGTFGAGGLWQMQGAAGYELSTLPSIVGASNAVAFFFGGKLSASGTGNNDTSNSTIIRVTTDAASVDPFSFGSGAWISAYTSGETSDITGSVDLVAALPNRWRFSSSSYGAAQVGATLEISGDVNPSNNGSFPITAYQPTTFDTGGQTDITTEIFSTGHLPTVSIELGDATLPFTFFLQGLAAELTTNPFRFIGALVKFTSTNAVASGTYRIISVDPSLDGTIYTERVTQADDIPAQFLVADTLDGVIIFLPVSTATPFQPTYFLVDATGQRAFVGMFDRLTAYNAYRHNGVNTLHGHLTGASVESDGTSFVLPTVQERVNESADNGQVANASTVALKSWVISSQSGNGVAALIPGTAAVSFEKSSFPEDGFALAPEAPWLIGVDTAPTDQIGLTTRGVYTYTVIVESQDSEGQRVFSPPSPPLVVALTGANNRITIGSDLPVPLSSTGAQIAGLLGVSNRRQITISIERTSYVNATPTVTRYKITTDLKPNGLAPIGSSNNSGFTFSSDHLRWTYVDQNSDQEIQVNEQDYSQSSLPRFGAPNFSDACIWNDRYWLITSDGSLQFSTPLTDSVRPSYFPGFRVSPPATDRPVAVRPMQQFLIVLCEHSQWYLPATALPTAALADVGQVTIPSLIPLPFTNGCTGQAVTSATGTVYASTAGLAWTVTRGLSNDYTSQQMVGVWDSMAAAGTRALGMAIDRDQRLAISTSAGIAIYDFISSLWSLWNIQGGQTGRLATYRGRFITRMAQYTMLQGDDDADNIGGTIGPIEWTVELAGVSFGGVRSSARLSRLQIIGEWRGTHRQDVTISYPDDFPTDPTHCPELTPDASTPYLYEAIPGHGKASQFGVLIQIKHTGETNPGPSCALELLSAKVGIQGGQRQVPGGQRF